MNTIRSSRKPIIVGFSLLLILLLGMGALGMNYMSSMQDRMDNIVHVHSIRSQHFNSLRNIARERSLLLYQMNLKRDVFFTDDTKSKMSLLAGEFIDIRFKLQNITSPEDSGLTLEDILPDVVNSTGIQRDIIQLLTEERYEEANTLLTDKSIPVQDALLKKYDILAENEVKKSKQAADEAAYQYQLSLYSMAILGAILLSLGLFISVYLVRQVTHAETVMRDVNAKLEERVNQRTENLTVANEELEKTLEQLQNAQSQLVQSEKMASLGSLVAGISHEINTPVGIAVTAISHQQEQSNALRENYESGNMKRSDLENYVAEMEKSNDLIVTNLLRASEMVSSFKRVAVDQSNEHWESINLYDYIKSTIISLHPKFKNTQIEVENKCDPLIEVFTNPGAIYQIISNLMLNSLIHAFENKKEGRIVIDCEKHGDAISLKYSDDGKGMTFEEQSKAFDPFFTTKRGQGGSGLGLHLVYNLVTSGLGGYIELTSSPGNGAYFQMDLPCEKPAKV